MSCEQKSGLNIKQIKRTNQVKKCIKALNIIKKLEIQVDIMNVV